MKLVEMIEQYPENENDERIRRFAVIALMKRIAEYRAANNITPDRNHFTINSYGHIVIN